MYTSFTKYLLSVRNTTTFSTHTFINICKVPSCGNMQKLQDKAGECNQQQANLTYQEPIS